MTMPLMFVLNENDNIGARQILTNLFVYAYL